MLGFAMALRNKFFELNRPFSEEVKSHQYQLPDLIWGERGRGDTGN